MSDCVVQGPEPSPSSLSENSLQPTHGSTQLFTGLSEVCELLQPEPQHGKAEAFEPGVASLSFATGSQRPSGLNFSNTFEGQIVDEAVSSTSLQLFMPLPVVQAQGELQEATGEETPVFLLPPPSLTCQVLPLTEQ